MLYRLIYTMAYNKCSLGSIKAKNTAKCMDQNAKDFVYAFLIIMWNWEYRMSIKNCIQPFFGSHNKKKGELHCNKRSCIWFIWIRCMCFCFYSLLHLLKSFVMSEFTTDKHIGKKGPEQQVNALTRMLCSIT